MTPDGPADPDRAVRFRAMSFNARVDQAGDGDDAWTHRKEAAASVIRLHDPAVVGCQELLAHQLADLREALPAYEWIGEDRGAGDRPGEHVAIGYRTDRFRRREHGTFWLSETPEVPGSLGWDAAHPRIVTWLRLEDSVTGADLLHLNTHLDHRGERARRRGASLLIERLEEIASGSPVLVTGDMNCRPGSTPYERLTERLEDAREVSTYGHHGPGDTFHGFTGTPEERIDYILVDSLDARQHATLADRWDDRYPSDHFPVLAELAFR
ncbi:MAG: endonuclease/exonuclease/phosphatase family protein [Halobacteriales archaeon]